MFSDDSVTNLLWLITLGAAALTAERKATKLGFAGMLAVIALRMLYGLGLIRDVLYDELLRLVWYVSPVWAATLIFVGWKEWRQRQASG